MRNLMGLLFLAVAVGLSGAVMAAVVVHAEGQAESNIGEHVARKLAKSRAFSSARKQCQYQGFSGEPKVIAGSGYDTAHAWGHNWQAHYFADFECSDEAPLPVNYGPWPSEDGTLSFQVLPNRASWWIAKKECGKLNLRVAGWKELSESWRYLVGTTPIQNRLFEVQGCASLCPVQIWSEEEHSKIDGHHISNSTSHAVPDHAPKEWKFAVVCVK